MEEGHQRYAWKFCGKLWSYKLCIILLFKANLNQLNKFMGKEMMYQAEENGLVAGEQYGSQHGKNAITQSLNKCLAFNLIHQFKRAAKVCSTNDAKSCYDQIVHRIMVQSMYRCRVPKPVLVCIFTTLQNLQHHVRMLYRDSTVWAGMDIWAVPASLGYWAG